MSTGTTEEWIASRLESLEKVGLKFTYVIEGEKHWLKSKWGYFLSWPTAKQVDDYLGGMQYGAEHATPAPDAGMPPEPMVEPGTPLPWRLDVRVGVVQVYAGEHRQCLATNSPVVVQKNGHWNEEKAAWEIDATAEQDLAYIVHACNRLPKLEADYALLKSYIQRQGKEEL